MTPREEIAQGENVALEFKEAGLKDSQVLKDGRGVFAYGRDWRTVPDTSRQFE